MVAKNSSREESGYVPATRVLELKAMFALTANLCLHLSHH